MNEPASGWPEPGRQHSSHSASPTPWAMAPCVWPCNDQRVDAAPDIVDRGIAGEREPAGLGIDLDLAHRAAIGEDRIVHFVVGRTAGRPPCSGDSAACPRAASSRKSKLRLLPGAAKRPSAKRCRPASHRGRARRSALPLGDQLRRGHRDHRRGMAHRAAGMRAAADADDVGVAHDDVDALDRHAKQLRRYLGEAGLVPLPGRLRADHDIDPALGHRDLGALARRADRGFDVIGEPRPTAGRAPRLRAGARQTRPNRRCAAPDPYWPRRCRCHSARRPR